MNSRALTVFLVVVTGLSLLILVPGVLGLRLVGVDTGYQPDQPIAFSHRLHAGDLNIQCLYCHGGAEKSRHAGVPAIQICMNCHRSVSAPLSDVRAESVLAEKEGRKPRPVVTAEIRKVYQALGLDDSLQPDPMRKPAPVKWNKVHNLPDFAYFDHRPHVNAGVDCRHCHGPVETMERIQQSMPLTMGWCVNCHRTSKVQGSAGKFSPVSTDCSSCHY